jgi:hypothetical protein
MAAPAPRRTEWEAPRTEEPEIDPYAVQRRIRRERAKRRSRIEHRREQRFASLRFLFLIGVLIFLTLFISLTVWEKVGTLFGI